jgi:hypothetical protein
MSALTLLVCAMAWYGVSAEPPKPTRAPATQPADDRFPLVERYLEARDLDGFVTDAKAFLNLHPDSPYAARLWLDLLAVFQLAGRDDDARKIEVVLFLAHPDSMQTKFLLKRYETAKPYRELLVAALAEIESRPQINRQAAIAFVKMALMGEKRFGDEALNDSDLFAAFALLWNASGDGHAQEGVNERFRRLFPKDETLR